MDKNTISKMADHCDKGPNIMIPLSPRKSPTQAGSHSPGQPRYVCSTRSKHVMVPVRSISEGAGSPSWDQSRLRANSFNADFFSPCPPPSSPFLSRSAPESPLPLVAPMVPWLQNRPTSPASATAAANAALSAAEHERNRAAQQQKLEETMTEDQLRAALKKERLYSCKLAVDLATLKSAAVSSQAEAEAYEEGRINCLMRKLDFLSKEKGRIIVELEREEEMVGFYPHFSACSFFK